MKTRHDDTTSTSGRYTRGDMTGTDQMKAEITDWLRDAYGMERGLETALEKHANNNDLSNEVRERARTHLAETRAHAERVKAVLQTLGSDTSTIKTGMGVIGQGMKGMLSTFASDERIKDLLDSYMMEHFEI